MKQYYTFISEADIGVATPEMLAEWQVLLEMDIAYFSQLDPNWSFETQKKRKDVVTEMQTRLKQIKAKMNPPRR